MYSLHREEIEASETLLNGKTPSMSLSFDNKKPETRTESLREMPRVIKGWQEFGTLSQAMNRSFRRRVEDDFSRSQKNVSKLIFRRLCHAFAVKDERDLRRHAKCSSEPGGMSSITGSTKWRSTDSLRKSVHAVTSQTMTQRFDASKFFSSSQSFPAICQPQLEGAWTLVQVGAQYKWISRQLANNDTSFRM